jgi:hypothetical protein
MPNLTIQTPIVDLVIWPGELHFLTVYVRDADTGGNFNCTGYTLKAKWTIGTTSGTLTGTFVNANNGHGEITTPTATTELWPKNAWGTMSVYLDDNASTTSLHITDFDFRTAGVDIP